MTKLLNAGRGGVLWGSVSGFFVALTDLCDTMLGGFQGNKVMLAAYSLSATLLVGAVLGGLLATWGACCLHALRGVQGRWGAALRASLLGLVGGAFLAWVPHSWITEHWSTLSATGTAIAIGVHPAAFAFSTLIAALALRVTACYGEGSRPKFHFLLLVGTLLFSALAYWADRSVLVGLYDDFHYGLSAAFVAGVTASIQLAAASNVRLQRWVQRLPKRTHWVIFASTTLSLLALHLAQPDVFGPSNSVVFSKLSDSARKWTDFDADGTSHLFGGSDCRPFDANVSTSALDLPGDALDDDCSGSAAQWPAVLPALEYPVPERAGYNLLLITVDALRADHLGAWGYSKNPTSPNMDALAARSVRFARAFSPAPKTYDAMPALATGLYPSNVPRNYRVRTRKGKRHKPYVYRVTKEVKLLAETLQAQGYMTGAAHGISLLEALGLNRGFAEYKMTRKATDFAIDFLERKAAAEKAATPFFLWLHYFSPHYEYKKREGFDFGSSSIDRYDSEIAHDDHQIGILLRRLSELGLDERTIVILTADHGEEFREHGGTQHSLKLYRELIHVPLLLAIPGVKPSVVNTPVELTDVIPTLCEVLRLSDVCESYDGQSLLAALAGQRPEDRGAYSELYRRGDALLGHSLYTTEWHMIYNYARDRAELYDVVNDEKESTNVAREHPELVQQLRDRLAIRPLYRQGLALQKYQQSHNAQELATALPIFRNPRLLSRALQELEQNPKPTLAPYLRVLLKRPDLDPQNTELAQRLLSQLPARKAPQKRKSGKQTRPQR